MPELNPKLFTEAAREHGNICDSFEVEVTDLKNMLEAAIALMPAWVRAQFVRSEAVLGVFHDAGVIDTDEPEQIHGMDRIAASVSGAHPCRMCQAEVKEGNPCANHGVCIAWRVYQGV